MSCVFEHRATSFVEKDDVEKVELSAVNRKKSGDFCCRFGTYSQRKKDVSFV